MFTYENTQGFTDEQIELLNKALKIRMERGEAEKNASDAIIDTWVDNATIETLTK